MTENELISNMYSLKKSTENSQKLFNFEKRKARFGSVLKAKSSARLAFSEKSSARLAFSEKSSARLALSKSLARLGSPKSRLGPKTSFDALG